MGAGPKIIVAQPPRRVAALWLGPTSVVAAWLGLFLAVISPPQGLGLPLCWVESATGIPCLGCGLTRSLSCGLRGHFLESWHYHPLGLFILGLFLFTAGQSLLSQQPRERLRQFIETRPVWFYRAYVGFVVVFVGFGLARALFSCLPGAGPGFLAHVG